MCRHQNAGILFDVFGVEKRHHHHCNCVNTELGGITHILATANCIVFRVVDRRYIIYTPTHRLTVHVHSYIYTRMIHGTVANRATAAAATTTPQVPQHILYTFCSIRIIGAVGVVLFITLMWFHQSLHTQKPALYTIIGLKKK